MLVKVFSITFLIISRVHIPLFPMGEKHIMYYLYMLFQEKFGSMSRKGRLMCLTHLNNLELWWKKETTGQSNV